MKNFLLFLISFLTPLGFSQEILSLSVDVGDDSLTSTSSFTNFQGNTVSGTFLESSESLSTLVRVLNYNPSSTYRAVFTTLSGGSKMRKISKLSGSHVLNVETNNPEQGPIRFTFGGENVRLLAPVGPADDEVTIECILTEDHVPIGRKVVTLSASGEKLTTGQRQGAAIAPDRINVEFDANNIEHFIDYDFTIDNQGLESVVFEILEDVDGTITPVHSFSVAAGQANYTGTFTAGTGDLSTTASLVSGSPTYNAANDTGTWVASWQTGATPVTYTCLFKVSTFDLLTASIISIESSGSEVGTFAVETGSTSFEFSGTFDLSNPSISFSSDKNLTISGPSTLSESSTNVFVIAVSEDGTSLEIDTITVGNVIDSEGNVSDVEIHSITSPDTGKQVQISSVPGSSPVTSSLPGNGAGNISNDNTLAVIDAELKSRVNGFQDTLDGDDVTNPFGDSKGVFDALDDNGKFSPLPIPADFYSGISTIDTYTIDFPVIGGVQWPSFVVRLDHPGYSIFRTTMLIVISLGYLQMAYNYSRV